MARPATKLVEAADAASPGPPPTDDRGYQRWVDQCIALPQKEELAEIKAVLAKRHGEDEVNFFLRKLAPILKSGIASERRERRMMIVPRDSAVGAK